MLGGNITLTSRLLSIPSGMNEQQANELKRLAKEQFNATKDAETYGADLLAIDRVAELATYQPPLKMTRGVDKVRMIIPRKGEFTIRDVRANFRERFPDDPTTDVVISAYVSRLKSLGEIVAVRQAHGNRSAVYVVGNEDAPEPAVKVSLLDWLVETLRKCGPMPPHALAEQAVAAGHCRAESQHNTRGAIARIVNKTSKHRFSRSRVGVSLVQNEREGAPTN